MANAFVTVVHTNPSYFCGALVLSYSLLFKVRTKANVIVMVTPDVADAGSQLLRNLGAQVVVVDYIEAKAIQSKTRRFAHMYQWLNRCFTKYQVLRLTKFDKVVFLDADMLALGLPDELFDLPAPAGICSSIPEDSAREQQYWHGKEILPATLQHAINTNYGIRGCLLVLEPRIDDFEAIKKHLIEQGSYGSTTRHIGPDECLISEYFSSDYVPEKRVWTHVHSRFGCNSWKDLGYKPVIMHFVSEKPWAYTTFWDDFRIWEDTARELVSAYPACQALFQRYSNIFKAQPPLAPVVDSEEEDDDSDNGNQSDSAKTPNSSSKIQIGRGRGKVGIQPAGSVGRGSGRGHGIPALLPSETNTDSDSDSSVDDSVGKPFGRARGFRIKETAAENKPLGRGRSRGRARGAVAGRTKAVIESSD